MGLNHAPSSIAATLLTSLLYWKIFSNKNFIYTG